MNKLGRFPILPLLVGVALLFVFLFSLSSFGAPVGTATVPTPIPTNVVAVKKSVNPSPAAPGAIVTFTVKITLGSAKSGLSLEDNLSGPIGTSDYVANTVTLDGLATTEPGPAVVTQNRVTRLFPLPSPLGAGEHLLKFKYQLASSINCTTYISNGANLRQGSPTATVIAADVINVPLRCGGVTTSASATSASATCFGTTTIGDTSTLRTTTTTTRTTTTTTTTNVFTATSVIFAPLHPCSTTTTTVTTQATLTTTAITATTTTRFGTTTVTCVAANLPQPGREVAGGPCVTAGIQTG